MTLKRNRTANDEELLARQSRNNPNAVTKDSGIVSTALQLGQQRPPPPAQRGGPAGIGDFLKFCYYCNKEIPEDQPIFMYRDFCAFCSVECRDIQIDRDDYLEKPEKK